VADAHDSEKEAMEGEQAKASMQEDQASPERQEAVKDDETDGSPVDEKTVTLRDRLRSAGNDKAVLLDSDRNEVCRVERGNLLPELRDRNGEVSTVVVDGELSQATLDAASAEGVDTVVGDSVGDVAKEPFDVNLVTLAELP